MNIFVRGLQGGLMTLGLVACSGSGSDGPAPPPPPTSDTTPPTITVQGDSNISLDYGSAYEDEGATAQDDRDGNVTVSVSGSVDTLTAGTYTITYTASDSAGNQASATRTVIVAEQQYRLDVSNFGAATISTSSGTLSCNAGGDLCSTFLDAGTTVTLTAEPDNGWTFENWLNCESTSSNTCTVTVSDNTVVYASSSSDAAVTLESGVTILSDALIDSMINYTPGSNIIFFEAGTNTGGLDIGDVIVSSGTDTSEIYFAKRIMDIIALPGSPVVMETVDATLDEVIASGTIYVSADLDASTLDPSSLPTGIVLDPHRASPDGVMPFLVVGLPVYQGNGVSLTLEGTLDVDFDPDIAMHFTDTNGIEAFRFAGSTSIDAALGVKVSGEIDTPLSVDREFSLGTIKAGLIVAGPAVFLVEIEPIVTIDSSLSVAVTPNVTVKQAAALGLQWHRKSGWTNLSDFAISGNVTLADTPSASISADAGGGLKPTAKLYGLAGPFLKSTIYGGAEYTLQPFDECELAYRHYLGGRISGGGEVGRVGRRLSFESPEAYIETAIESGTIDCPVDTESPEAPQNVSVEPISERELQVSWSVATDNVAVASFEVWRRDASGERAHLIGTTTAQSYLNGGLEPETEYCYYVIAVDAAGNKSEVPLDLTCGTTLEATDAEAPSTPSDVTISDITSSSMTVNWGASTDNDAVGGYIVFDETLNAAIGDVGDSTLNFTASPLNPNTEYCFSVAAVDVSGNESTRSAVVCETTLPAADAQWTAFIGCQARPFLLQQNFDLPTAGVAPVGFAGTGADYDGTALSYVFQGQYNADSGAFASDIVWSFEGQSSQRIDRFTADLSTGDSGVVAMEQIQVTGCDAQIQIVSNDGAAPSTAPQWTGQTGAQSRETLGGR
ncbi:immunoglobulin-like domain-containing protein [Henriciella litoralis]|uniref:immunoglobulin-like domain-containing protein n=1 Tax=Henriciella litoralis TaxID=568102 RepID=UPI0009FE11DA|nr:immunoglobulin-like domain-containing protein [Henriciella litoralis]